MQRANIPRSAASLVSLLVAALLLPTLFFLLNSLFCSSCSVKLFWGLAWSLSGLVAYHRITVTRGSIIAAVGRCLCACSCAWQAGLLHGRLQDVLYLSVQAVVGLCRALFEVALSGAVCQPSHVRNHSGTALDSNNAVFYHTLSFWSHSLFCSSISVELFWGLDLASLWPGIRAILSAHETVLCLEAQLAVCDSCDVQFHVFGTSAMLLNSSNVLHHALHSLGQLAWWCLAVSTPY